MGKNCNQILVATLEYAPVTFSFNHSEHSSPHCCFSFMLIFVSIASTFSLQFLVRIHLASMWKRFLRGRVTIATRIGNHKLILTFSMKIRCARERKRQESVLLILFLFVDRKIPETFSQTPNGNLNLQQCIGRIS